MTGFEMAEYGIYISEGYSWPYIRNLDELSNDELNKLASAISAVLCRRHNEAAKKNKENENRRIDL